MATTTVDVGVTDMQATSMSVTSTCPTPTSSKASKSQQTLSKSAIESLPTEILAEIIRCVRKFQAPDMQVATSLCLKASSTTLYKKIDVRFIAQLQHPILDKGMFEVTYLFERDWPDIPLTARYVACGLCKKFHARTAFSSADLQRPIFNTAHKDLNRRCIGGGPIAIYTGETLPHPAAMLGLHRHQTQVVLLNKPVDNQIRAVEASLRAIDKAVDRVPAAFWTSPEIPVWGPYYYEKKWETRKGDDPAGLFVVWTLHDECGVTRLRWQRDLMYRLFFKDLDIAICHHMDTNMKLFITSFPIFSRTGRCDRCRTTFELQVEGAKPDRIGGHAEVRLLVRRNLGYGNIDDPEWVSQVGGDIIEWRGCFQPGDWEKLKIRRERK